jgi:large subunit ribosomal protein L28e
VLIHYVSVCRIYQGIANNVAKNSYRSDLRGPALSRASAIQDSQRVKKETPEKKLRGSKAKKSEKV